MRVAPHSAVCCLTAVAVLVSPGCTRGQRSVSIPSAATPTNDTSPTQNTASPSGSANLVASSPSGLAQSPTTAVRNRKPASTATLPATVDGWNVAGPIDVTPNIDTASYATSRETGLTVISIIRNPDVSARQMLAAMQAPTPEIFDVALCSTVAAIPASQGDSAVICLVDLDGGVLNVTGPNTITIADYATLATTLYGAFAA